jgi:hypothetical protein
MQRSEPPATSALADRDRFARSRRRARAVDVTTWLDDTRERERMAGGLHRCLPALLLARELD